MEPGSPLASSWFCRNGTSYSPNVSGATLIPDLAQRTEIPGIAHAGIGDPAPCWISFLVIIAAALRECA